METNPIHSGHDTSASHFDYLEPEPEVHRPAADAPSPSERVAAISSIVEAFLREHPEDAYEVHTAVSDIITTTAQHALPVVLVPERYTDEEGARDAHVINPRTGEEDVLVAVDVSVRHTEIDTLSIDSESRTVRFDYDGVGEHHGLLYITESDNLPVSLPEGWEEGS